MKATKYCLTKLAEVRIECLAVAQLHTVCEHLQKQVQWLQQMRFSIQGLNELWSAKRAKFMLTTTPPGLLTRAISAAALRRTAAGSSWKR
jgi:hypothetical protein